MNGAILPGTGRNCPARRDAGERKGPGPLAARLPDGEAVAPEALEHYGITVRYLCDNGVIIEVPGG